MQNYKSDYRYRASLKGNMEHLIMKNDPMMMVITHHIETGCQFNLRLKTDSILGLFHWTLWIQHNRNCEKEIKIATATVEKHIISERFITFLTETMDAAIGGERAPSDDIHINYTLSESPDKAYTNYS